MYRRHRPFNLPNVTVSNIGGEFPDLIFLDKKKKKKKKNLRILQYSIHSAIYKVDCSARPFQRNLSDKSVLLHYKSLLQMLLLLLPLHDQLSMNMINAEDR